MKFIYKPEGVEPREWLFEPNKLLSPEAEVIERRTGMMFGRWVAALTDGSILAIHGLLFVLLKREEPTLKWEQVVFSLADVDFDLDDDEEKAAIVMLEKAATERDLSDGEQDLLAQFKAKHEGDVEGDVEPEPEPEVGPGHPAPVGELDPKDS